MLPPAFYLLPIPKDFWSEYLDAPFCECIDCGGDLQQASVYVIQKKLVAGEAVFEMALCEACRDTLTLTYSEETKLNVNRRMKEQFESNERRDATESPVENSSQLLDRCLNFCLFCGIHREAVSRYSIAGLFHQETLVVQRNTNGQSPVMVCEQCERLLIPLISKQTRDSWDRFVADHFDGPPGVEHDAPRDQPMMF